MSYLALTVISVRAHFAGQMNPPASSPCVSVSPYTALHPALKPLLTSVLVLIWTVTSA